MAFSTEATVEHALLDQLRGVGYQIEREEDIGPEGHSESKGRLAVLAGHEMGFREVLGRRRYELDS